MAATAEAARLTEAHRLAQLRLGADTVRQMQAVWPLLNPADLNASFADWMQVVGPIVQAQRSASSALAANYITVFRSLELGVGRGFTPILAGPVDTKILFTSMLVTGPVSIQAALDRSVPLVRALDTAEARSAGAAMRHALNGGRETIVDTTRADRRAIGWARATSASACAFCAMLASRGPVYSGDTVDFRAHDHCACGAEPMYRDDAGWPSGARRYRRLWDETTGGLHGDDALNAFRTALAAKS